MAFQFSPPSASLPPTNRAKSSTTGGMTYAGIANQYKAPTQQTTSGLRGAVSNTQSASLAQQKADPLAAYQDRLRKQMEKGQQYTNTVVSTANAARNRKEISSQTAFSQKYGVNNRSMPGARQRIAPQRNTNQSYKATGRKSPGGWGGFSNGNIPINALKGVSFARGAVLYSPAAAALEQMNVAYRQAFGTNISITDSYRSMQGQINVKRTKGGMAATPGTSVHGWGKALDLGGGINNSKSAQHQWMQQNAGQFGFKNPDWAKRSKFEPWHWEFQG